MKRRNKGLFFIILGLLLIALALSLTVYYEVTEYRAVQTSSDVLSKLDFLSEERASSNESEAEKATDANSSEDSEETSSDEESDMDPSSEGEAVAGDETSADGNGQTAKKRSSYQNAPYMPMPVITIDGIDYIGVVEIPSLGIRLPVASDFDDVKLNQTACRYWGSLYQDNLIVCAHRWAQFFGNLNELRPGASVIFTDIEGNVFNYVVTVWELVPSDDEDYMVEGDWDLTLFTCADVDLLERITIRCVKE